MRFELSTETAATADWTNRSYETAAWWQHWRAQPGSYEVERHPKPDFYNPVYFVSVEAISGDGYFAALWGGVPVSREYDTAKHRGERGKIHVALSARACLTDPRVVIEDESEYDAVLAEAITEAEKDFEWRKTCLERRLADQHEFTRIGKPMIPAGAYRHVADAASLLQSLYSTANSRAQAGYETTRMKRKAA